ncbi:M28 family peptidase [Litorilituus lipolyticus]|uniref:M28 family peptidase n=1 Tax=Litorilituus lipolyticus TaxID=2491017 RepID=A0A502KR53_9GAMM|nr:M28 family peptidase [Litorilituus lipolyticus]TPH12789.1 M28 family peptidase [Litorilituus lipolyticus]
MKKYFSIILFLSIHHSLSLANDEVNSRIQLQQEVLLQYIEALSSDDMQGRKFATNSSSKTQDYLINALKSYNIQPFKNKYLHRFNHDNFFNNKQGANVIGFVPGNQYSDKYIVLTAHYDHLGVKGKHVYNGADDNASGVAALLTFGKLIKETPLKHNIILLFTDGEEINLLGARSFIRQNDAIKESIMLNINVDMIAGDNKTKRLHYIYGNFDKFTKTDLVQQLFKEIKTDDIKVKKGFKHFGRNSIQDRRTNWKMASDHGVFANHDIPYLYYGVGTHKNYHSVSDTYANVNKAFAVASSTLIFKHLLYLDNSISLN